MSRFNDLLKQTKARAATPVEPETAAPAPSKVRESQTPAPSPAPSEAPTPRRPGRPPGKRSDPGFIQATAYLPLDLHYRVKLALLQERKGREFSELVAELLDHWLDHRPGE